MGMKRVVPFGPWLPDQAALVLGANGGLRTAKGVLAMKDGYRPMGTFLDLGFPALATRARGFGSAIDSTGNSYNFAGEAAALTRLVTSGNVNVTRVSGGAYSLGASASWEFCSLNNVVFATQIADLLQYFDLATSSDFADINPDPPPKAAHCAVVEDFVVLANLIDGSDEYHQGVQWSAIGNGLSWPTPGSTTALEVQSGRQPQLGAEGCVQRVIGGPEVGYVMCQRGLFRMDYTGGDIGFAFYRAEPERGLLTPGAACGKGRIILYLDEDGWYVSNFGDSEPIGEEAVNRWFLNDLAPSDVHRITMVSDPDAPIIWIGYRSSSASGTDCDRVMAFNTALGRFTYGDQAHEMLVRALETQQTLDDLGSASLDDLGSASLDDFETAGPWKLGGFGTDHALKSFDGTAQAALLETGDVSLMSNRVALLQSVYPLGSGGSPTVQVSGTRLPDTPHVLGPAITRNRKGTVPTKVSGRYHRIRVNYPAGWAGDAVGYEWEAVDAGEL